LIKSEPKYQFGSKLREIREREGITMKDVAERSHVSESLISQIERNKVSPSIDTLLAVCDVLGIDMEYLFRDYRKDKSVRIVKKDERKSVQSPGILYQQLSVLADPTDVHAIEAFLLEVETGAEKGSDEFGHPGKEFGFILQGTGEFHYGTQVYSLTEGDSITYTSDIPHVLKNTGMGVLKAVWIITPPRMLFFKEG